MSHYQFETASSDEDSDDEFYFDDKKSKINQLPSNEINANIDQSYFQQTLTEKKTKPGDHSIIQISSDYEIKKQWLNDFEKELSDLKDQDKKLTVHRHLIKQKEQNDIITKFEQRLFNQFNACKDPYWFNLILIENCKDFSINKFNTLSVNISKCFEKWSTLSSNSNNNSNISKFAKEYNLNDDIKIWAFSICTRNNLFLMDSISRSYKLNINNEFLIPYFEKRSLRADFKDKATMIAKLELQDKFDLEQVLCPLLLQGKINIIEKYLSNNKNNQIMFVKYLDKMCAKDTSLYSYTYKFPVPEIKMDKLNTKFISKLANRLIKSYDLDPTIFPNIISQEYHKNLKYLIYRRYVECSIAYEPWKDLVAECLKQADNLEENFLMMLSDHNDVREMIKWVKNLNLNLDEISSHIKNLILDYQKKNNETNDDIIENNEKDNLRPDNYHILKLETNKIKFIENKAELFDFLEELLIDNKNQEHIYVGIDAEWKPTCASVNFQDSQLVALVQVATNDSIYLIDMIKLYNILDVGDLQVFSKMFFCNKKIIKIGYGTTQDIKVLCSSFNTPTDHHDQFRQSMLDLAYLVNYLLEMNIKLFEDIPNDKNLEGTEGIQNNNNYKKEKGLSELVRLCFGKPLNKSEQISNWERRPLRKSQIDYAALDAYCLIEIFDYIKNRLKSLKIDLDLNASVGKKHKHSICISKDKKNKNLLTEQTLKDQQLIELKKFEEPSFVINENPIKPNQLRVVCDNMLGGLGKELRRCGVDAVILENERDHTDVAKICRQENRFALTSGLPYFSIRSQLPEGRCIHVKFGNAKEQSIQVLKLFNVQVTMDDLFSRCRKCNTGIYTVFSKNQIKGMWFKYRDNLQNNIQNYKPSRPVNYDVNLDADLIEKVNLENFTLKNYNTKIQLENIFDTTIEVVETYFVCCGCGHVYWEGPHWQTLEKRFSHVLNKT